MFGTSKTTGSSLFGGFGGFGTSNTTSTATSTGVTSNAPFSFGTAVSTASRPAFSFNPTSTTTTPSLFGGGMFGGSTATTSAPAGGGIFGFAGGTGSTSTGTTSGFGGFSLGTTGAFGSTAPKPPASTGTTGVMSSEQMELLQATLVQPQVFNDERDQIVARWNQLQALWGTGTGFSSKGTIKYTPQNPFCKMKAIAYNVLPTTSDADGLVVFCIGRKPSEVISQRQNVQDQLFRILNSKSNLKVYVEEMRPADTEATKTEVLFYVVEKLPTGADRRITASELTAFLNGNAQARSQLQSQLQAIVPPAPGFGAPTANPPVTTSSSGFSLGGTSSFMTSNTPASNLPLVRAHTAPSERELQQYRDAGGMLLGLHPTQWQEACQRNNPDPKRLLPVPLIGMADLKRRMEGQAAFAQSQLNTLKKEASTVHNLKSKITNMNAKIGEIKRKQIDLSQRLLKVLCSQEVYRKQGLSLSREEEQLRANLDRIWTELTSSSTLSLYGPLSNSVKPAAMPINTTAAPGSGIAGLKSRLRECISHYNSAVTGDHKSFYGGIDGPMDGCQYVIDSETQADLENHFSKRYQCIEDMMRILKQDQEILNIVNAGVGKSGSVS